MPPLQRVQDYKSNVCGEKQPFKPGLCLSWYLFLHWITAGHYTQILSHQLYWQFLPCFCPCFVFKIFLGQAFISFLTSRQNPLFNNIVSLGSAMSCIFSRQCLPKINKSFSKLCFWSTKSILSRNTTLTWCSIMNALYPRTCTFLHP